MVSGLISKTLEIVLRELSRVMLGEEAEAHRALLGTPHTLVSKQSKRVTGEQKASFLQAVIPRYHTGFWESPSCEPWKLQ